MATFPSGIVSFTNPSAGTLMSVVSHSGQHIAENNEITAIETALGINLANVIPSSYLSTSTTLAENSDTKVPSQKAVKAYADNMVLTGGGIPIGYLDTDGTLAANLDTKVASQKATVTYVAAQIAAAAPGTKVYASVATRDASTASGSVAYTPAGLTFTPKAIIAMSAIENNEVFSMGFSDGTRNSCLWLRGSYANFQWTNYLVFTSLTASASDNQSATIASFDTNGFTLAWTKNGSPTGSIAVAYLLIG